ncbi:hypothetical protein [Klebsiella pneumoniae]|uniref:hypothetical protein n=1 Tax=Klebsiella pneumoniae TaxID=573 RepID=UPI001E46F9C0|nr:hypothetical protein [Klebsiella pneumoniae]
MRYWILVALLNGLFTLVIHYAAPEMLGGTAYYAGVAICALIALVITGAIRRYAGQRALVSPCGELWLQVWRFYLGYRIQAGILGRS